MADLASLRISVDSTQVNKSAADLNKLSGAASGAEASVAGVGAAASRTSVAVNGMNNVIAQGAAAQEAAANAMRAVGQTGQLAGHHVQNLAFQFQDLGVQLASGANPLTAFVQQGSQISGIMMQAGIGVGGLIKQLVRLAGTAALALALNPAFLAAATAIGVAYVAFKDFQEEVGKSGELQRYAATLGLTEKEMQKLGPVGITATDVVKGLWKTFSDGLGLEKIFNSIGGFFADLFRGVASTAADLTAGLYGLFVGTYKGIVRVWDMLPAAFGDLTISAVNSMIRGLESLTNKAIGMINRLIKSANSVLATLQMPTISPIAEIDIPELQNKYAGAASKAGAAFIGEVKNATAQARGAMSSIGSTIGDNIIGAARERLAEDAGKIIDDRAEKKAKDAAGKAGKTAGEKFAEEMAKTLGDLNAQTIALDQNFLREFAQRGAEGMKEVMDDIEKRQAAAAALREEQLKQNLKTAQDGATMIADAIGGSFGAGLKKMSDIMTKDFPDAMREIGKAFDGLKNSIDGILGGFGTSLKQIGAFAGVGGAASAITGGSAMGGAVGGALGGVVGQSFAALGKFGGPIGAIAGGILGGVVGGLFKKTKSASATIEAVAGQTMQKNLSGNNAALKGVADKMASGLISALGGIAEQLGGTLGGNMRVSIGQRKNDFVVDPTGGGRTKGSGVINFGQDQAAAVAYVTQLAIQQGIITGISAGAQTLIRAGGDLGAQVEKALKFDQVFKDLLKETDPVAASLDDLATELQKLKAIFDEAGASAEEYAKLEELYAIKQAKAIAEADKQRRELEIQLMEAQGNAAGALAARRQLELESMDVSLRALQQQVWAAEDAAKAALELADAQARAAEEAASARAEEEAAAAALAEAIKALAVDRRKLEIDLMEALGNSSEALAARRLMELEAIDESLRGLQQQVWAAQDAAEAQKKLAEEQEALQKATEERIAEEQRAAQEAADQAARILRSRTELEAQLLELQGNKVEALAIRRQLELDAMDESLRGLQQQINAQQDLNDLAEAQRVASEAAAEAAAKAAEEAQRLAEDAAQKQLELAQKRASMEIQLLEAQGKAAEAVAAQRAIELAAMDESLRPLQSLIWSYQDAAVAQEAAAKAAEDVARTAEEAAAAQRKLAEDRLSLEIELMRALGDETGALAAQRARELSQMDESLRGLQGQIWAAEDAKKAQEALAETQRQAAAAFAEAQKTAAQAVEQARNDLSGAYEREANAIKAVRDRFAGFAASLREFRDSLIKDNGGGGYTQELARFSAVAREAALGNADAMGVLPEAGRNFLEAARANAGSAQDYQRDVARVMQAVDAAIGTADRTVNVQDSQLLALTSSVEQLIDLNTNVLGVEEAIKNLNDALITEAALTTGATTASGQPIADVFANTAMTMDTAADAITSANQVLSDEVKNLREEMRTSLYAIAKNTGKTYDQLQRWDGDGLPETRNVAA